MPTKSIVMLSPVSGEKPRKTYGLNADGVSYEISAAPNNRQYHYKRHEFTDFASFAAILEAAEQSQMTFAIHAERIDWLPKNRVNKCIKPNITTGEQPCFRADPNGTSWLMIDIDDLANEWCDGEPADEEAMRMLTYAVVCTVLPPEFHEASYWFQWSNGMLMKGKGWENIKIHLWFMLSKPITNTVLCQWAESIGTIDPCTLRSVQINYLAPPECRGFQDPMGSWRSGSVKGPRDDVELAYTYVEPALYQKKTNGLIRLQQNLWKASGKQFQYLDPDYVSAPMRKIAEIGVNGRCHHKIIASACSWVSSCGENPDVNAWKDQVIERVTLSGHKNANFYKSNAYLDDVFRTAQAKYSPLNPDRPPVPRELLKNDNTF